MIRSKDGARVQARKILHACFGLTIPTPIPLFEICRFLNIELWERPMEQLAALAIRDGERFVILFDPYAFMLRQAFSLAHEIGHFACGHLCFPPVDAKDEYIRDRVADTFAAELLMPKILICYRRWTVEELSEEFGVSRTASRIRLEELGMVG